jgi:hypothetical protein
MRKRQAMVGWKLTVAWVVMALAAACTPAAPPTPTPVPIPEVAVEASDTALTVPAEMPAGLVAVMVKNSGQAPHSPFFARLNEGVTMETFMQTMQTDESGTAAIAQVTLLGGAQVAPGASQRMVFDLQPGSHIALDFGEGGPALPPGPAGSGATPRSASNAALSAPSSSERPT